MDLLDLVQVVDKVAVPQVVLVVMKTAAYHPVPVDILAVAIHLILHL